MSKDSKILNFINKMKNTFPEEIEFVFYRGYCYWFAYILAGRFKGDIWFNPNIVHFAAKINNTLYDVYGKVRPGYNPITGAEDYSENDWIDWNTYQLNHHEAVDDIVKSCIKKE